MMDRNGFYGSARFHKIASENGIKAHVGAEVSVTGLGSRITPPMWLPHQHLAEPTRLPLLCETREGYQNLCQLITRFKLRETTKQEGSAKLGDLEEYSRGLVCLTGGEEGPLAAALMNGGEAAGRASVERLVRIFGQNNVYVEVQRHRERTQEWRNQAALRIAESLHLPVLATNGVRYATRYDREIADLFTVSRADLIEAKVLVEVEREPIRAYGAVESDKHLPLLNIPNALHVSDQSSALRHEKLLVIVRVVIRRQHDEDWASKASVNVIGNDTF
jgi:error-prone DNA polymerase